MVFLEREKGLNFCVYLKIGSNVVEQRTNELKLNDMEIKSVNNSRQPNYPVIEFFVKHPELLSRSIPSSWLKNKFVVSSLAAFLLSGYGTSTASKSKGIEIVETLKTIDTAKSSIAPQKKKADKNNVINVAPVFLSEDEALKIILDKLQAEGYNFSKENCPTFSFEVLPIANCRELEGTAKIEFKMGNSIYFNI